MIEAVKNFDQSDGIHFVNSAGFGVIANRGRIAGDCQDVADAADGPRPEQCGLQANDILVARGEMRNGLDAAGFESAGNDERVHSNASHGAGVDVDGIHFT